MAGLRGLAGVLIKDAKPDEGLHIPGILPQCLVEVKLGESEVAFGQLGEPEFGLVVIDEDEGVLIAKK